MNDECAVKQMEETNLSREKKIWIATLIYGVVWLYSWEEQASRNDRYDEVVVGILDLVTYIPNKVKDI